MRPYSVEADRMSRDEWSRELAAFEDANIYQTWDYAATVFRGQKASRIVIRDGGEVVALAQARVVTTPVIKAGIAYVAWGPVWRKKGAEVTGCFEAALKALAEEYGERRRLVVRIAPAIVWHEGAEGRSPSPLTPLPEGEGREKGKPPSPPAPLPSFAKASSFVETTEDKSEGVPVGEGTEKGKPPSPPTPLPVGEGIGGAAALSALGRLGFVRSHEERTYRTAVLDVTRPLEEIRRGFAQKWRNCLNRAQKNNLEVAEGNTSEIYEEFLGIYRQMRERKSFDAGADAGRWAELQAALPESEKMHVFLARCGGRAIAGAVLSWMGERGIYIFGATSEEGLKSNGSYPLQWRAIERMKEAGCAVYDLGGIDPEGNPGVYHFKAGLGGREVSHVGTWEYCRDPLSRLVVRAGEAVQRVKGKMKRRRG